jgi:enamine deaminase RidA (YjgF/YER057c/UK114 family)
MNTAFEISVEDVGNVLDAHRIGYDADELHGNLDHDAIEEAALWGDNMEEQTNYAYQEIEKQLKEIGLLGVSIESKFP